jgi:hypothetical protein
LGACFRVGVCLVLDGFFFLLVLVGMAGVYH